MPQNPAYFPTKEADILAWGLNWTTLATAAPATYGLTAPQALDAQNAFNDFSAALTLATDPSTRTPVTVNAKNVALQNLRAVIFPLSTAVSQNAGVLAANKTALGVTNRFTTRTVIPPPASAPGIDLINQTAAGALIRTFDIGAPSVKARPYGAVGTEVRRTISTAATSDPDAATFWNLIGRSPFVMTFDPGDSGKVCTVWVRYRMTAQGNGSGRYSPWSTSLVFNIA